MTMIKKALGISGKQKAISSNTGSFTLDSQFSLFNVPLTLYNWDAENFISKGYSANSEVYKIIQKIIQKCGVAQQELYIDSGDDKAKKYRQYNKFKYSAVPVEHVKKNLYTKALDYAPEDGELAKLLKTPNSYQTGRDLFELFRIFYFVQGEAFLVRETALNSDKAIELHVLPPHRMSHILEGGFIVGWQYLMPDGRMRTWKGDDFKDVFHFKMANPNFNNTGAHLRGMSPLTAGLKYLQLDDYAIEAWIKSLQNEGAKGIISPNHPNSEFWLDPTQVKNTEERVQTKIHGIENKNKIVVSGMPLQYTQIGLSPDALNIINSLEKAGDNLADLWNVPSVLFEKNPTYQNQKEGAARFIRDMILPYLNKEEDALNNWLVEPFREKSSNYVIAYDTSLFDELRITMKDRDYLKEILTLNEMRVIEGYDEIDNEYANEVFVPQGKIPLSDYGYESEQ